MVLAGDAAAPAAAGQADHLLVVRHRLAVPRAAVVHRHNDANPANPLTNSDMTSPAGACENAPHFSGGMSLPGPSRWLLQVAGSTLSTDSRSSVR